MTTWRTYLPPPGPHAWLRLSTLREPFRVCDPSSQCHVAELGMSAMACEDAATDRAVPPYGKECSHTANQAQSSIGENRRCYEHQPSERQGPRGLRGLHRRQDPNVFGTFEAVGRSRFVDLDSDTQKHKLRPVPAPPGTPTRKVLNPTAP